MKGRVVLVAGVWIVVIVAASLAQTTVNPPPTAAPSPTPDQQTRPTSVLTPVPDAGVTPQAQPLTPTLPGPTPAPDTGMMREPATLAPGEESLQAEEALVLPEESRRRWRITPLLSAGVIYDDNIFVSNEDRVADVIWTAAFGAMYELGDFRNQTENYLAVQWIGMPVIYTENSAQNAFNQYVSIALQYRFSRLVVRWDSSFSQVKGPNREVNTITTSTNFWNAVQFKYDYSEKTSFNLAFSQSTSLVEEFQNTSQYQGSAGMDYQILPKTKVGYRGVVGVIMSTDTPIQYYQQALARVQYTPSEKLTFSLDGGVQFLEFGDTNEVKVDPVFSLGLEYQLFPGTSIGVVGFRNVVGSTSSAGQDYFATGFELRLQQQFFQKWFAMVSFGYENDEYFGTTPETPTDRVDDYLFFRPRLTYAFVDWFSASIFYEYRQTTSTQESSNFTNNRAGIEFLTRF